MPPRGNKIPRGGLRGLPAGARSGNLGLPPGSGPSVGSTPIPAESKRNPEPWTERTEAARACGVERILLAPEPGCTPSDRPAVRIFLGTEPAQYRAERVFLWSIQKVRDPARTYEIHLMRGMAGFRPLGWNTSFTNYRFAIPELAGGHGRAIYNDVDQIYLADPAELFDRDMGDHGFLAVSATDTSVMLIDCARMAGVWSVSAARSRRKYRLIDAAQSIPNARGPLEQGWNARDAEYVPGESKLLHYTTLHMQPWHPFPERFYYQPNPQGELWFELEREANQAGFHMRGPDRPSQALRDRMRWSRPTPARPRRPELQHRIGELISHSDDLQGVLEIAPNFDGDEAAPGTDRERLLDLAFGEPLRATHDGVVCTEGLDALPEADVPWVVDRLFDRARRFVVLAVRMDKPPPRRRIGLPPKGTVGRPEWWAWAVRAAAARNPDVHWEIRFTEGEPLESGTLKVVQGGAWLGEDPPTVWVLTDHKPGHTTQCVGLAEELGWPYEIRQLSYNLMAELPLQLAGPTLRGLTKSAARGIAPPWPDLVIATGRRSSPVAGWIRERSGGATRTVQMGRMGSSLRDELDLAVAPAYAGLYPDSRRIDTVLPLTRVRAQSLDIAAQRWKTRLERGTAPRIALLVGGGSPEHSLTPDVAQRMGYRVAETARSVSGSVFVTTSRRTAPAAADALQTALGDVTAHFHRWVANQAADENPYMGYLALADVLVATGDSASMLAEAGATGKPLYVMPLPRSARGPLGLWRRFVRGVTAAIHDRALAQPHNRRGIARPQKGIEHLCARLLAEGWVRPSPDIEKLHESLFENGVARPFDGSCELRRARPYIESAQIAVRVRELMGVDEPKTEQ